MHWTSSAEQHVMAVIPAAELRCNPSGVGDSPPTHHTPRQRIASILLSGEQRRFDSNSNQYKPRSDDTEASAAGRSGRACVAQSDGRRRGGERVQRPVGALARVCVSGPQNRKRSQEGINPPSELSRSLSRHNHGAAGGGHPIIELPCILYQTPRTLIRERFFTGGVAGFCGSLQLAAGCGGLKS